MEIEAQQLAMEFGGGALIGGIIGYATKRIAKVLAVIIGVQLALFRFLESKGIVIVDYDRLTHGLVATRDQVQDPGWIVPIISTLSIGAGFIGGFWVGYRRG
ncbi:FUN14 domain-containing protein [Natranaeroarchaeum sulfidigenes]|uniref:Putative membrane protein, Fun14 family n=1 Tax=Natranaeroarchaeum sulfidigenes TaxID=2784880 RepID=A0A897MSE6_9EURY|nr:FUN14 domain-containing protein [Natranaeroarchaeum sulfidigenes]QSG02958.1 putative membrane protein, Fun14 family [Natranaeroarchaeum sulfidigenes]